MSNQFSYLLNIEMAPDLRVLINEIITLHQVNDIPFEEKEMIDILFSNLTDLSISYTFANPLVTSIQMTNFLVDEFEGMGLLHFIPNQQEEVVQSVLHNLRRLIYQGLCYTYSRIKQYQYYKDIVLIKVTKDYLTFQFKESAFYAK